MFKRIKSWFSKPEVAKPAVAPEPKVVSAVATMAYVARNSSLSKRIEKAMHDAVTKAMADGISIEDSDTLRAIALEARENLIARIRRGN